MNTDVKLSMSYLLGPDFKPTDYAVDSAEYARLCEHLAGEWRTQGELVDLAVTYKSTLALRTMHLEHARTELSKLQSGLHFIGRLLSEPSANVQDLAKDAGEIFELPEIQSLIQLVNRATKSGASKAANREKRLKDGTQKDKELVFDCWRDWQKGKRSYNSVAAFVRDMLDKVAVVKSASTLR